MEKNRALAEARYERRVLEIEAEMRAEIAAAALTHSPRNFAAHSLPTSTTHFQPVVYPQGTARNFPGKRKKIRLRMKIA